MLQKPRPIRAGKISKIDQPRSLKRGEKKRQFQQARPLSAPKGRMFQQLLPSGDDEGRVIQKLCDIYITNNKKSKNSKAFHMRVEEDRERQQARHICGGKNI